MLGHLLIEIPAATRLAKRNTSNRPSKFGRVRRCGAGTPPWVPSGVIVIAPSSLAWVSHERSGREAVFQRIAQVLALGFLHRCDPHRIKYVNTSELLF